MFRPLALWIGLRYTRAKRANHFISFISATSIVGMALGVMALITVLSVMNGFEKELRVRILGMAAHATINGHEGPLQDWMQAIEAGRGHPEVLAAAPFVQGQAMLTNGDRTSGTLVRGVLPDMENTVTDIAQHVRDGRLEDLRGGEYGIVLGSDLARTLGVTTGDRVTLLTPQAAVTPAGLLPRLRRFTVTGVFEVGMYEYDRSLALIHIEDAQRLYGLDQAVTGVRLKLRDLFAAPVVVRELANRLPGLYWISDWTREHANFFHAVKTEKRVMFIILVLIVAVAAFNIVSTLVMVVTDKRSDIAVLRTIGETPAGILRIFLVQGALIGTSGTMLGIVGGVALALNVESIVPAIERFFGVDFLAADVYYISDLPSDLHVADVVRIAIVSFLLSLGAALYPAWRASRIAPAEALRYE